MQADNGAKPNFRERFADEVHEQEVAALKPEIRASFDELEHEFFAEAPGMMKASSGVKSEFVCECWRRAEDVTDRLIADLERRNYFIEHVAYRQMWDRFNRESDFALA